MSVQLTMAWRYLRGRGVRTLLTTLAVALGVMVIFGLNGITPSLVTAFRQATLASSGQVDLTITSDTNGTFDPTLVAEVQRVDGVAAASPALRRVVALPPKAGVPAADQVSAVTVDGVDPATVTKVRTFPVAAGRFLNAGDGESVVMSQDLAGRLGVHLGDELVVPSSVGTQRFRVVGLLSTPSVPGQDEVFVPLPAAQQLFALQGRIDAVDAAFVHGADRAAVEARVKRAVGSGFTFGGLGSSDQLLASLQISEFAFNMFGVFALVAGGFIILNTFRTVVSERRHDVGMLRALGATRGTITGMFLTESVLQGLLGTGVGILAGWALAIGSLRLMESIVRQYLHFALGPPTFTAATWATAVALGVLVTVASALLPAISAGRLTPLEALRPSLTTAVEKASRRRAWIGAAICIVGVALLLTRVNGLVAGGAVVFLIGLVLAAPTLIKPITDAVGNLIDIAFSREGLIARSNLQRNPGRSAATASAVMISLAVVVAMVGVFNSIFAGFTDYIDKSMGADFLLIPQNIVLAQGNVGSGPELVKRIEQTPEIAAVSTLRLATGKVNGSSVQVLGVDPSTYLKVADFTWSEGSSDSAVRLLKDGRHLIANGIYASQNRLQPGDRLTIETPQGPKSYIVAGIGSDYLNAKLATVYVSQGELEKRFGVTTDVLIMANLRPGADKAAAKRALDSIVTDFPAFRLFESSTWKAEQLNIFQQTSSFVYVLVVALALPSLLALVNTLAISVISRTREIGMLRAVGSTRGQVRRMVLAESLLLAAVGTLFGLVTGVWLGYALVQAMNGVGFPMPYTFPWAGIVSAVVVALIFAAIAAALPARQAARLDVVEALRYE